MIPLLLATALSACAGAKAPNTPVAAPPNPAQVALVGLTQAAQLLAAGSRSYDPLTLTRAARSLSACASSAGADAHQCAALGTRAAWLLSCVQEAQGKQHDALASAVLAGDLAETAVSGLTPTAETHALLADAYMRRAWLSATPDSIKFGAKAVWELRTVVSPTAQSLEVQAVLARRRYFLPGILGGDTSAAVADFERLQALDPQADLYPYYLGLALREQGHPQAAKAAFQKALALDPDNALARAALGLK